MYKNPTTGVYEHDFRFPDYPRYHISYGVSKKADAERLHATAVALFRSRKTTATVIEGLRRGALSIEQLAQLREMGQPFTKSLEAVAHDEPWPAFVAAVETYVEALKRNENRAPNTARTAEDGLARFTKFLRETGRADIALDAITSTIVEEYQAALIAAGYRANTYTAYVSRVGSVFHWFIRREARQAREMKRAPRLLYVPLDPETISRAKTSRLRYLSESEAQRLLAATPRPLLAPVVIGLFAGLRVDEMCHLRTEHDIDLELGVLSVQRQPAWRPKTKRSVRHVPIADIIRRAIEEHLERYASDQWLMPTRRSPDAPMHRSVFSRYFARIVRDADLIAGNRDPEGVTYHTLRHTFASWSLMKGTDVFTVAKLLGNTVKQVEDTYGHLALDFRKAAVDRLAAAIQMPTFEDGDRSADDQPGSEKTATENATRETVNA